MGLGWQVQEWNYAQLAHVVMGAGSWMETRNLEGSSFSASGLFLLSSGGGIDKCLRLIWD